MTKIGSFLLLLCGWMCASVVAQDPGLDVQLGSRQIYLGESVPMIAHKTGQTDHGVRIIRRALEAHFRRYMRKREPAMA